MSTESFEEPPHAITRERVLDALETDQEGLTPAEARARLERFGPNEIEFEEGVSALSVLIDQYRSFLIWLLILAAVVMLAVEHYLDAGVIIVVVTLITIFGFIQDYRAERSIEALLELASVEAVAIRDGQRTTLDTRNIVPGDIVILDAGDIVPADARLLTTSNLSVDEAALTGESHAVDKDADVLHAPAIPLAERTNLVFKDTIVTRGSGVAVVFATGAHTEMGTIAKELEETVEVATPFQTEMDRLGKTIAAMVVVAISLIIISEYVIGTTDLLTIFLTSVGIAVSAVPEGLPAVVTLTLALGARRMVAKNALVRRLPIVEALGSVDVICTDKTGTLTEGRMTVTRIFADDTRVDVSGVGYDPSGSFTVEGTDIDMHRIEELLRAGLLCNNAERGWTEAGEAVFIGDPTENALVVLAEKAGLDPRRERERYPRLAEVDFTSDRKLMTTVHHVPGLEETVAYTKGAPEEVLARCTHVLADGQRVPLTDERRERYRNRVDAYADDALRVLAFATRDAVDPHDGEQIEHDLTLLGLVGMLDPPRAEVPESIAACQSAGIRIVMITGDNPTTARAIASSIGIDVDTVMTGVELDTVDDSSLTEIVEEVDVFARTTPAHKARLLRALQQNEHTVAMTGDGVNDAPAVKQADVGIAMGVRGTDVTEQASDIVLLDDNFVTIRDAVEEGRGLFDNVRKFVNYLLSGNSGEVLLVLSGTFAGLGLVITPVQIIWINLVTDGIPAVTLGVDQKADDVMERPPRPREQGVITRRIMSSVIGIAILMAATILPLFYIHRHDVELARTMVFTSLVTFEIVRIQAIRRRYNLGLFSNRWLILAICVAFALQLVVLYTPAQTIFGVKPLGLEHWFQILVAVIIFIILMAVFVRIQDRIFADRY